MSRIKYSIFVFLVVIAFTSYGTNSDEGEKALLKNEVEKIITGADLNIEQGNHVQALDSLESAIDSAEKVNDQQLLGRLYFKIANLHFELENYNQAKNFVEKALEIHRLIGNRLDQASTYHLAGKIEIGLMNFKNSEVLSYLTAAKNLFAEESLTQQIAEVDFNQAIVYIQLGKFNLANKALDEVISVTEREKRDKLRSAALIKKGEVAFEHNKLDESISFISDGAQIAKDNDLLILLNESYQLLNKVYLKKGDYRSAHENLKLSYNLNNAILSAKSVQLSLANSSTSSAIESAILEAANDDEAAKEIGDEGLGKLTTILSVALITILSLLTLSLYKNNNIRLKTNNMLYKKNEELLTEKERAEIAAKTKSNFLSTVTHELRTPLYAVTGLTNMLLEENPKPEQMQHLKSLKFSGDYLLTFINDILQINKIEANKVELDPEIFNLKNKVDNVISALNNSAVDNNVMIHFHYDKNLSETFHGDQLKISQILINLVGNSIKFTKDGDIWVRVYKIKQKRKNVVIKLEVEDNGIGISQEKQDHMFESFSQGSVQINRKYGGTGLGLSIVKGLVDILKGKIYMKSELGEGTTFSVEFPLEEAAETVKVKKTDFAQNISELDLSDVRILVVEDNKINQMITKKILTKMELICDLVDNGEDAIEKIKATQYDVVLMDIHMPGISGIETTKRVRVFDKELTIFALTAVTLEDKMQEFDEAGFDDIISKPFKQEDFEKKLYQALAKNRTSASA